MWRAHGDLLSGLNLGSSRAQDASTGRGPLPVDLDSYRWPEKKFRSLLPVGERHGKLRLLSWLFCSVGGEVWGACGQQRHLESSDLAREGKT